MSKETVALHFITRTNVSFFFVSEEAQKLASASRQQQLGTQKGTGETPSQVASVEISTATAAQKVTSQSKEGAAARGKRPDNFEGQEFKQEAQEEAHEYYYEENE